MNATQELINADREYETHLRERRMDPHGEIPDGAVFKNRLAAFGEHLRERHNIENQERDASVSPSKLIGTKMLELLDHPRAARLQATVIAMACMGVYSVTGGVTLDVDLLILTTNQIESKGCFPLRTLADCVSAFDAALDAYASTGETRQGGKGGGR